MSLKDEIKKAIGDEQFKILESKVKLGEFIPIEKFNAKLEELKSKEDAIKGLESEKKLALEELEQSKNAGKSELEKLADNFKKLEEKLEKESELRTQSEKLLNEEKTTNSLKSKLSEAKLNPKYLDLVLPKFKGIGEDEFADKLKEFTEQNKELFGENVLKGDDLKGGLDDNNKPQSFTSLKEWKESFK